MKKVQESLSFINRVQRTGGVTFRYSASAFVVVSNMLKICSTCGKFHKFSEICPVRLERIKQRQAQYDRSKYESERSSKADKFRNTKAWQRKRNEIKDRDLNICRCCFLCRHRIITEGLSVHHIIPLEKDFSLRLSDKNLITLCRQCHEEA